MATVNLGRIKFVWQGAYNGATAYVADDVVSYNGSSYICILASTGNLPTNTTYWSLMAQSGTDITSLAGLAQGDVLYYNGTSWVRLGAGTSGQYLKTNGTGANPSWSTVTSGTYSVHAISKYNYQTDVSNSGVSNYIDISGGNYVSFTPTSTNDLIYLSHTCPVTQGTTDTGVDTYLMMSTSSSIGSGDTKLNYDGQHAFYVSANGYYLVISKSFILPCTSLTPSTTYYIEQAGGQHGGNAVTFNKSSSQNSGSFKNHNVNLIHYKYN